MRHRTVQRDPAEPPPCDRITDLPAQRLTAQPVAELQKHQPQIGLHRCRRTPDPQVEERRKRGEEHRIIQQLIDPRQLVRQLKATRGEVPPPTATPDRLQYETRWPRSLLPKGLRPSSLSKLLIRATDAR